MEEIVHQQLCRAPSKKQILTPHPHINVVLMDA